MRITGDLPSVVAQGFKVLSEYGPVMAGALDLADIDKVAALNNVVHIEAEASSAAAQRQRAGNQCQSGRRPPAIRAPG
jgi:hypothetical protein